MARQPLRHDRVHRSNERLQCRAIGDGSDENAEGCGA
jgi:hypothetical protein